MHTHIIKSIKVLIKVSVDKYGTDHFTVMGWCGLVISMNMFKHIIIYNIKRTSSASVMRICHIRKIPRTKKPKFHLQYG